MKLMSNGNWIDGNWKNYEDKKYAPRHARHIFGIWVWRERTKIYGDGYVDGADDDDEGDVGENDDDERALCSENITYICEYDILY